MQAPDGTPDPTDKRGVAAVDRALAILAALEGSSMPRNLSEIARATGLYKSTILRLMQSLQDAGYVVRLEETKYALGPAIMQLGLAYERANPLRHLILPVMQRLVAAGSESPSFHIRHSDEERLCLFRLDSRHSTLDRINAGDRLPLRQGAAGKVLRAFGDHPEPGAEMDAVRAQGFAVSLGERDRFSAAIAAPVFSARNRLVGALSLSGPRERFGDADLARMKPVLLEAARALTASLGAPAT